MTEERISEVVSEPDRDRTEQLSASIFVLEQFSERRRGECPGRGGECSTFILYNSVRAAL